MAASNPTDFIESRLTAADAVKVTATRLRFGPLTVFRGPEVPPNTVGRNGDIFILDDTAGPGTGLQSTLVPTQASLYQKRPTLAGAEWVELGTGGGGGSGTAIVDQDADTFVDVESTPDNDTVRMRVGDNSGNYDVSVDAFNLSTAGLSIVVPGALGTALVAGSPISVTAGRNTLPGIPGGAISLTAGSTAIAAGAAIGGSVTIAGGAVEPGSTAANNTGGHVFIRGGNINSSTGFINNAGRVEITGGTGTGLNASGGRVDVFAGAGIGTGSGGALNLQAGNGRTGGATRLVSGNGDGAAAGTITIQSGSAISGNQAGGNILIACGSSSGTGAGAGMRLTSGSSTIGGGGAFQMFSGSGNPGGNFSMASGNAAPGTNGFGGFFFMNAGSGDGIGGGGNMQFTPGRGASAATDGGILIMPTVINTATPRTSRLLFVSATGGFPLFSVGFRAPITLSQEFLYTWPDSYGAFNSVLTSDGSGGMSWTTPATHGFVVSTGSRAAPLVVGPATGISLPAVRATRTMVFLVSSGGVVSWIVPNQVDNGTADGQELLLIGRDSANAMVVNTLGNVVLGSAGPVTLGENVTLTLVWDGVAWVETSRNG